MKVLLTHGYFLKEDEKEQAILKPYPPLGILYISAFLEQNGITTEVFDSTFSEKALLKAHLIRQKPKYVAIYVNLMTKVNVLEIIDFIKKSRELQHTTVILGGPEVTYNTDGFLNHGADFLVIGEGEETMLELITSLDSNPEQIPLIDGIAYKNQFGNNHITTKRSKMRDIDHLPMPNRKAIDLFKYLDLWKKTHGSNAISVSTMRGCPYTCKWCSRAVYGLSYRRRSPAKVVDELEWIQKNYNPDTLWFVDDVFTVSHKWLEEFNEILKERNLKISYECITRADRLNEDVIRMMKESGCFRVWIGAESGSQKIIDLMDRRVDVQKVRDMIKLARKNGIEAGTFIMIGYPGETESDIEETIHHLKSSNPDHFTITVAYPIKGTELYQEVESLQTTKLEWSTSSDREIDFERTYSRGYYDHALRRVISEVHYFKNKESGNIKAATRFKIKSIMSKLGMQWEKLRYTSHA
ncbi:B12-binding domain-containing radical SAM protein [Fulvivirga sp. 29W222]|uniref:B12-binding domain-containing radical SAM protein n=1 Tax=Fulvivirga marina TaxID=2494733 RepID=A0A937G4D1_9BACT|nr:radical SAM protein [Fulvivirga marina]MBL6449798.1 B12-binding domain-containing radical SAM protein [Fulvivirga marina]